MKKTVALRIVREHNTEIRGNKYPVAIRLQEQTRPDMNWHNVGWFSNAETSMEKELFVCALAYRQYVMETNNIDYLPIFNPNGYAYPETC